MRALLLVAFFPLLFAQTPVPTDPWADLRAKNPADFAPSLRLTGSPTYHTGELIPAEAAIPGVSPGPRDDSSQHQWQFGGFLLSPLAGCGSIEKTCFTPDNGPLMIRGPWIDIAQRPGPTPLILNSFLPVLPAGHYQAVLLLRRLVLKDTGPLSNTYGYPNPPQYAVSNSVAFDVIPANRAWIQQTVATTLTTLRNSDPQTYDARSLASQQIASLGNSRAWKIVVPLLPLDQKIVMEGLSADKQDDWVCYLLQNRLAVPDQDVTSTYFNTMVQVCSEATVPAPGSPTFRPIEARIATAPPRLGMPIPLPAEQQAYLAKFTSYRDGLTRKSAATLAASLPQKQPGPLADAFTTLIEQVSQARNSSQPTPEWISGLMQQFMRLAGKLENRQHYRLLYAFANTFPKSPELVPVFEAILDERKRDDYAAPQNALEALYKLDPSKAQARILAELGDPKTWLTVQLLNLLPANSVPPMDDALIDAFVQAQPSFGGNAILTAAALAKYGTPAALTRLKAVYQALPQKCHPELMAYFLRVDPDYADGIFHSHAWDMQTDPPPCTGQYFQRTAALFMHPALERYMTAYLMHNTVRIKSHAAQMLELYGSKSAVEPLWKAFRYFHEYWKDQRTQLPSNREGVQLELALRKALARGNHWLADEADLRLMQSLCISNQCIRETQQDLDVWRQMPLRLQLSTGSSQLQAWVAQYSGLESIEAIEDKLSQFPVGTEFMITSSVNVPADAITAIRQFAEDKGLVLINPPGSVH